VRPAPAEPVNTTEGQKRRRWSVSVAKILGLPDDPKGQEQILASAIATAARIDETTLQPGLGPYRATTLATKNGLMADPTFARFATELDAYEQLKLPREAPQAQALRAAAIAAKRAAGDSKLKVNACDDVLSALKAQDLRDEIIRAGMPPWSGKAASRATAAKVELDLLSMPLGERQMRPLPPAQGPTKTSIPRFGSSEPARLPAPRQSRSCASPRVWSSPTPE
jgi:hypothetical protein